jgi:hypothetical protein
MNEPKIYKLSDQIKQMPEAAKLQVALDRFCRLNVIERLHGNCIAASDILQNILDFYGIKSRTTECQVFAAQENREIQDYRMVGFNTIGLNQPNIVDTHVVVITETTPALLIDASIGYLLPADEQIIIHALESFNTDVIAEHVIDPDMIITYHYKKNIKLPSLHQKNLLQRIEYEHTVSEQVTNLKLLVWGIVAFTVVNFILNMTLVINIF